MLEELERTPRQAGERPLTEGLRVPFPVWSPEAGCSVKKRRTPET